MFKLIQTAKLNGADPQAWLADVLARIAVCGSISSCPGIGSTRRNSLPLDRALPVAAYPAASIEG